MAPDETVVPDDGPAHARPARVGGAEHVYEHPGMEIGPYRLMRLLGEGGFGTVWLAERRHPFVQQVALKIVKAGMDSRAVVARFEQERQALAVMNHPNVAKVLDGGLTMQGRPYFAMEYVRGEPINEFCDRQKYSVKERLELFGQVCEAVQHAHTKGIIHRDLKPSNVLVSMGQGDEPEAKVIDFGIAKAVSGRMTEQTVYTRSGQMIGTPEYMSPEQADPGETDVDTRTDVYSLGVILYELLTGALPFDAKDLRSRADREIQRVIREEDPPTPSARLSTIAIKDSELATRIAAARKEQVGALASRLRSELEWIPLKAIRKDRKERYDSPSSLARDIENYLAGRPLVAAPESAMYRIRKYVRRNRALVLGAAAVAGALGVGLVTATFGWAEASRARTRAETAMNAAVASEERAVADRKKADQARSTAESLYSMVAINSALEACLDHNPMRAQTELFELGLMKRADRFDARLAMALANQSSAEPVDYDMMNFSRGLLAVAASPDSAMIATGSDDSRIRRYSFESGQPIGGPMAGHSAEVTSLVFSPNGSLIASASWDRTVRIWSAATGSQVGEPLRGHKGRVNAVAFAPDGKVLASGGSDKSIILWDAAARTPIGGPLLGHSNSVTCVAFSPDGRTIASGSTDKSIRLWDAASGQPIGEPILGHREGIGSVAFSPDGRMLASTGTDGTVHRWQSSSGRAVGEPYQGRREFTVGVAFVDSGRLVATCSERALVLLDAMTGAPVTDPLNGHWTYATGLSATADGKHVVTCDRDGSVRTWDVADPRAIGEPMRTPGTELYAVCHSPDGATIAATGSTGLVQRWDALTGRPVGLPMRGHGDWVNAIAYAGSATIVSAGDDATVRRWDAVTGTPIGEPMRGHTGFVLCIAVSQDGKRIASGGVDRTVRLWDAATGAAIGEPLGPHSNAVRCLAFSPDGALLAVGTSSYPSMDTSYESDVVLWRLDNRSQRFALSQVHRDSTHAVAFNPSGKILLSLGEEGGLKFWTVEDGKTAAAGVDLGTKSDARRIVCGSLSPKGEVFVASGAGGSIRIADMACRRLLGTELPFDTSLVRCLSFSPDDSALAACAEDGSIRIWDTVPLHVRIGRMRARDEEVRRVREMLAETLSAPIADAEEAQRLQDAVLGDARLQGELRTAALIVVGEEWARIQAAAR